MSWLLHDYSLLQAVLDLPPVFRRWQPPAAKKNSRSPPAAIFKFNYSPLAGGEFFHGEFTTHVQYPKFLFILCGELKVYLYLLTSQWPICCIIWSLNSLPWKAWHYMSQGWAGWGVIRLGGAPPPPQLAHNTPARASNLYYLRFSNTASDFEVWLKWVLKIWCITIL